MRIHIDIRDSIEPEDALYYVMQVVERGRISKEGKQYCYLTEFYTKYGKIHVVTRDYRKSDCFVVYRAKGGNND